MGGFFGIASKYDCMMDVFFGVDYHSHLGTRRGGMAAWDPEIGLQRVIHSIENSPFRTKFENIFDTIKLWEQEVEPFMRIYDTNEDEGETDVRGNGKTYTDNLIKLFNNNTNLLDELIGKSDEEIAACIKKWSNERDKFGKPLINNPKNNLRKDFAQALKENGIISGAVTTFRKRL